MYLSEAQARVNQTEDTGYVSEFWINFRKHVLRDRRERTLRPHLVAREQANGTIAIQYHSTDIVTVSKAGTITLNTGGHMTYSTKQHINRFLPAGAEIHQRQHIWYVDTPYFTVPYQDGLQLNPLGYPFSTTP